MLRKIGFLSLLCFSNCLLQAMLPQEFGFVSGVAQDNAILRVSEVDGFVDLEAGLSGKDSSSNLQKKFDLKKVKRAAAGVVIFGSAIASNYLSPNTTAATILTAKVGKYLKPGMKDMNSVVPVVIGASALAGGYGIEYHLLPYCGVQKQFGLTLMGLIYFGKAVDQMIKKLGTKNKDIESAD